MLSSLDLFKKEKKKVTLWFFDQYIAEGREITEEKNISRKSIDRTRPLQRTQRWALQACW